ncbi:MAG: molybdenum cofactor synthesis protein [Deltaproteobacteria bacterium]|nr:MAG: molybdenum cofactor synthesis protein [Deltaproteobacteria bacterium]
MSEKGKIVSVNVSEKVGTIKKPVGSARIDGRGVVGDAHAGPWLRQVSLLSSESIRKFAQTIGRDIAFGEFAENITTGGIDLSACRLLDHIEAGGALLEVTQIGKKCHGGECAIFRAVGKCVMPKEGIFCRVVRPGKIAEGDSVRLVPKKWRFVVVTASDRCFEGLAEDESGPVAASRLEQFLESKGLAGEVVRSLSDDSPERLRAELEKAAENGADAVFITGGTGIGPRDNTPEAISSFCEKLLPGVMDAVRLRAAEKNPNALLSRATAGVRAEMLVFGIPGSPRAVRDYLDTIEKVLLHAAWMAHGLDAH